MIHLSWSKKKLNREALEILQSEENQYKEETAESFRQIYLR